MVEVNKFDHWEPAWMERDEWAVWSVELPDGEDIMQEGAGPGGGGDRGRNASYTLRIRGCIVGKGPERAARGCLDGEG